MIGDDPCDRARRALTQLCGEEAMSDMGNTFYIQARHQILGRNSRPGDANAVAEQAENALVSQLIPLLQLEEEGATTQSIVTGRDMIHTYWKLPRKTMTPSNFNVMMERLSDKMGSDMLTADALEFMDVRLVDSSLPAADVPEMVGPALEDVERM